MSNRVYAEEEIAEVGPRVERDLKGRPAPVTDVSALMPLTRAFNEWMERRSDAPENLNATRIERAAVTSNAA